MQINFKKTLPNAKVPTHGSEGAAGYDLYATNSADVAVGETVMFDTGLAVEIPYGYFGGIYSRSGLACKKGLYVQNNVGILDSDYRGSIKVALHNNSKEAHRIEEGDRIAQLIVQPYQTVSFYEVNEVNGTVRGEGGFGSSGQ